MPRLRAFVRQQGDRPGSAITEGRDGVERWLVAPHTGHRVPEGRAGQTVVRSLAQWILDYRADLTDAGFPFDVPALALYDRCLQVGAALRAFLGDPPVDPLVCKNLDRLQQILRSVDCAVPPFVSVSLALSRRVALFTALRDALRLHGSGPTPAGETPREAQQTLLDIRTAVATLEASLRARRPTRGPETDLRRAIDVILAHLHRHGPHLWGHVITATVGDEMCIRVVDRTNDCLESFFHGMKHGERRRSGRKILTQDFERLPSAAALAVNLTRADYVEIVCGGSLDRLPAAFARLDAGNRSRSIAAVPPAPLPIETASLSSADRRVIRIPALTARIVAAAQAG